MYRYMSAAIEPCMHLSDTLQGKQHDLPDFLTCSSFLPSMISNIVQQVSLAVKGPKNSKSESAPSESEEYLTDTQWCTSCKNSMSPSEFVSPSGKVTASCATCLAQRKGVYHTRKSQLQLEATTVDSHSARPAAEACITELPAVISKIEAIHRSGNGFAESTYQCTSSREVNLGSVGGTGQTQ